VPPRGLSGSAHLVNAFVDLVLVLVNQLCALGENEFQDAVVGTLENAAQKIKDPFQDFDYIKIKVHSSFLLKNIAPGILPVRFHYSTNQRFFK
jgi:hypothetical protein